MVYGVRMIDVLPLLCDVEEKSERRRVGSWEFKLRGNTRSTSNLS
jgi:hypothetical protein